MRIYGEKLSTKNLYPLRPSLIYQQVLWQLDAQIKLHYDGSMSKYKAKLVACGFFQIKWIDYQKTFS